MKKTGFTLLLFVGLITWTSAQSVQVNEASVISKMMFQMAEVNQFNSKVEGWRIQILATTDRRKMEKVKTEFQARYPLINIDWVQEKPYYKLRAGAFSTKLEAARLLNQLKRDYPSAYTAKDNTINPRELIGG